MSRHKTNHVNMNSYVFGLGFNVFILFYFIIIYKSTNIKCFKCKKIWHYQILKNMPYEVFQMSNKFDICLVTFQQWHCTNNYAINILGFFIHTFSLSSVISIDCWLLLLQFVYVCVCDVGPLGTKKKIERIKKYLNKVIEDLKWHV